MAELSASGSSNETTLPSDLTGELETDQRLSLLWLSPEAPVTCLQRSSYVIGRGDGVDIPLGAAGVSRRHAEIYRDGPIYALRDLGSRNGTFLNGERLSHAPLRAGQLLRIGEVVALVALLEPEAHGKPPQFDEIAPGLFGGARLSRALLPVRRAAGHDLPIVLQAETGTGKELVARQIHAWSNRSGPFYAVNCAALPAAMVEGELFGYRKGAFTGAQQAHLGHVRAAQGGTLFLDEVAELPLDVQAKLLRVLQEREVQPLGESKAYGVDVRVVCACQGSLPEAVRQGRFRADLHARLAGYVCVLPALRERREDIPRLFAAFAHRFSGGRPPAVDARFVERLCLYSWPDNVRELELFAHRSMVLHGHEPVLKHSLLPEQMLSELDEPGPDLPEQPDRRSYELARLAAALRATSGNLTKAVAKLGISRQRAYRLLGERSVEELLASEPARAARDDESS